MNKIALPTLECLRCGHKWFPKQEKEPLRCPKCGSPYWNKPLRGETRVIKIYAHGEMAGGAGGTSSNIPDEMQRQVVFINEKLAGKTIASAEAKEPWPGWTIVITFTDGSKCRINSEYDEGFIFRDEDGK